ncbi:MAG: thioesterase family protein [Candidatus Omnitrophota bacterium]
MTDFTIKKIIYYHDTDSGGVVYYANYLKFFEEARTEFFRAKGINFNELINQQILFCVSDVTIKYKAPACYADELLVLTKIGSLGNVYIDFLHEIKKDGLFICECKTRLVCIDKNFKPQQIPRDIAGILAI